MNKSVYILIALFTLCISSCSDENDIFDSSSARRMNAMLQECNEILTGAENGWILNTIRKTVSTEVFNCT